MKWDFRMQRTKNILYILRVIGYNICDNLKEVRAVNDEY